MQALQLLSTLRAICNDTVIACNRQEYKTGFIHQLHNQKLQAIHDRIAKDNQINKSVKQKYFNEVRKVSLAPTKVKDYTLMRNEINSKLLTLSSAVDFMKKR